MPNIDGWTSIYNKNGAYGLPVQTPGQIDQVTLTPVQGGGTVSTIQSSTLPITGGGGPVTDIEGVASIASLQGVLTLDQILNEIYSNPAYANYPFVYALGEPAILGIQQCGMDYTGVQDIAGPWAIGLALVANNVNLEKLWIGSGLFTAKSPLASPSSYMTIEGAGKAWNGQGPTTIQADPTFAGGLDLLKATNGTSTLYNLSIKNLLFSGAMANPSCRGLVLESCQGAELDGVAAVGNFSAGIFITSNPSNSAGAHGQIGTLSVDMPQYNLSGSPFTQLLPYPRQITCSVTAGSNVLTVTSGTLTSADYGSLVTMIKSQTSSYDLTMHAGLPIQPGSFLTAITSSTTATMNLPAGWSGTVTGLTVNIGEPIGLWIGNTDANGDVHNWKIEHLYINSNGGPDTQSTLGTPPPPAIELYGCNSDSILIEKWHAYDGGGLAPNVEKWFGDYCTKVSGAGGLHPGDWLVHRTDFDLSSTCTPTAHRYPANGVDTTKGQFNIIDKVIWENGGYGTGITTIPGSLDKLLIAPWNIPNLIAPILVTGSAPFFYANPFVFQIFVTIQNPQNAGVVAVVGISDNFGNALIPAVNIAASNASSFVIPPFATVQITQFDSVHVPVFQQVFYMGIP